MELCQENIKLKRLVADHSIGAGHRELNSDEATQTTRIN